MRRGEVWWADLAQPAGRRPVVLLSRDSAYSVRDLVTIAPVTTRVRNLPVEVPLGPAQGLPKPCCANLDCITTVPKHVLVSRLTALPPEAVAELDEALRFALGLD